MSDRSSQSARPWMDGPASAKEHCNGMDASGIILTKCGCSSMVEHQLPKLRMRVQFPSPAPGQIAAFLAALFFGSFVVAAELSGYAVLTTDYVYRGVSYSDSHGAVQLGGDLSFDSGIYFGAWGSTIDIGNWPGRQRDLEVDYYLGYAHDISSKWSIGANVVSYNFPGAEGSFDYDYVEYSVSGNYNDRIWLEYSYSPDLFHSGLSTQNIALYAEWQTAAQLILGAGAGFYDVSELTGSDYSYWQLGITRPFGVVDIDLRYFDASDWVPIISTPDRAEQRIVLSARIQF